MKSFCQIISLIDLTSRRDQPLTSSRLNSRAARAQAGLTLVEIVIVLVILSVLIGFLTKGLFATGATQKARINVMKMEKLKSAINQYQLMSNGLPPSLDALVNCSGNSGSACFPVAQADDLIDLFGGQFRFAPDGSGNSFSLKTLGADKRDGGSGADADVVITGP
jgi:general secretion pathway protein G